jgi:hypothetical protein
MDSGHSFNKGLDVTRFNLVVAVFKWASILCGRNEEKYHASSALWFAHLMAWVESVNGGTDFQERQNFLKIWHSSTYNFVMFSSDNKNKLRKALIKLGKDKPPVDGYPLEFFTLCCQGDIQKDGFDTKLGLRWPCTISSPMRKWSKKEGRRRKRRSARRMKW